MEPQIKQESSIDARSFVEIYKSLNETEKQALCASIASKTGVTRTAIRYWGTGERTPNCLSAKRDIAASIKSVLGLKVSILTLFTK